MSKVDISRERVQRLIKMDAVPNYVVAELLNEVDRLQRAVTSAMDRLSNGDIEAGARLLRECFWGTESLPVTPKGGRPVNRNRQISV